MSGSEEAIVQNLMNAVTEQAKSFLKDEVEMDTLSLDCEFKGLKSIQLRDLTTIITVICRKNAYVAFSFDESCLEEIFNKYCDELDIDDEDKKEYIEETAGDVIDIVLGNATPFIENDGMAIHLTPPVMISEARSLSGNKDLVFYVNTINTKYGALSILCGVARD